MKRVLAVGLVAILLSSMVLMVAVSQPRVLHDVNQTRGRIPSRNKSIQEKLTDAAELMAGVVPFYVGLAQDIWYRLCDAVNDKQETPLETDTTPPGPTTVPDGDNPVAY